MINFKNDRKFADFISNSNRMKTATFEIPDRPRHTEHERHSFSVITHDAYQVSYLGTKSRSGIGYQEYIYSVKLGYEIFNFDIAKLLSILIRVYPTIIVSHLNKSFAGKFSKGSLLKGLDSEITGLLDERVNTSGDISWLVLIHKDTRKILKQIFGASNIYEKAVVDHIVSHITNYMYEYINIGDMYKGETKSEYIRELLYRAFGNNIDVGIQILKQKEEFNPLTNLIITDCIYEDYYNYKSSLDDSYLSRNDYVSDNIEQTCRLLNKLGRFSTNHLQFSSLSSSFNICLTRFGLFGFIAYNLLDSRYSDKYRLGVNTIYERIMYERSFNFDDKLLDINVHITNGPKNLLEKKSIAKSESISNIMEEMVLNNINVGHDRSDNAKVILAQGSLSSIEGIKYNEELPNKIISVLQFDLEDLDNLIYDLNASKSKLVKEALEFYKNKIMKRISNIYKYIENARYKLHDYDGTKFFFDLNEIEAKLMYYANIVSNHDYKEKIYENLGEPMKFPKPFIKCVDTLKAVNKKGSDIRNSKFGSTVVRALEVLISTIPGGSSIVTGANYLERKSEIHKTKKDIKKKNKVSSISESKIIYNIPSDKLYSFDYIDSKRVIDISEADPVAGVLGLLLFSAGITMLIKLVASIIRNHKANQVYKHVQLIDAKLDLLLAEKKVPESVKKDLGKLKEVIKISDTVSGNDVAFGEKYEMNNGVFDLYGPEEREFRDPKDVVSMTYRLLWNLKNTDKIKEFKEIKKIVYSTIEGSLYGLFVTTKAIKYVFRLDKVYSPIPNTISQDKVIVSPEDHNIPIQIKNNDSEIKMFLSKPSNNEDDKSFKSKDDDDEVDGKVIEDEVLNNDNIDEEKKEELIEEFEDNLVKKLEDKGLDLDEDE